MPKIKLFFAILLLLFLLSVNSDAQNNFAYINTDVLVVQMEESKAVSVELRKLGEQLDVEFQELYLDYDLKRRKYESESSQKSEAINKSRAAELAAMEEKMQEFRRRATKELNAKQEELMKPVIAKMNKAIEEVAKENGIDFVIDTAKRDMAYTNGKFNLLDKVKKKLGID